LRVDVPRVSRAFHPLSFKEFTNAHLSVLCYIKNGA
jgi:hypothetical protein